MKKLLPILICIFTLLIGCENTHNTPTSKVEELLSKYQNLDQDVLNDLANTIDKDEKLSNNQKKEYKVLLEKQYQNLSYKITNEEINNKTAIVEVEIQVLDYQSTIQKSKLYYEEHEEEIKEEYKSIKELFDYQLKEMKKTNETIKYNLVFTLDKKDNYWSIRELTKEDISKIHGLY